MKFYKSNRRLLVPGMLLVVNTAQVVMAAQRGSTAVMYLLAFCDIVLLLLILHHFLMRVAFRLEGNTLSIQGFTSIEHIPLSMIDSVEWNAHPKKSFLKLRNDRRVNLNAFFLDEKSFNSFKTALTDRLSGQ